MFQRIFCPKSQWGQKHHWTPCDFHYIEKKGVKKAYVPKKWFGFDYIF